MCVWICFKWPTLIVGSYPPKFKWRWFCVRHCWPLPTRDREWPPGPPEFRIDGKAPPWSADATALAGIRQILSGGGLSKEATRHLEAASKGMLESLKAQLPEDAKVTFEKPGRARGAQPG